jgi:hypothetical protein
MNLEYRRGVELKSWQRLWHFSNKCPSFPSRNFAIRRDRPSDDDLCSRCYSASGNA